MHIVGGYNGHGRLMEFVEVDLETKEHRVLHLTGDSPGARETNGMVLYKDSLYIFGGTMAARGCAIL